MWLNPMYCSTLVLLWCHGVAALASAVMDEQAVAGCPIARVIELAKPSARVEDRTDRRDIQKATETIKLIMRQNESYLLQTIPPDQPCMRTYSSDGTPVQTTERIVRVLTEQRDIKRKCKTTHEFLVHRQNTCTMNDSGELHSVINFTEPIPLTRGKSGWALFSCLTHHFTMLREDGFKHICISHYAFDRGCFSILSKFCRRRHISYYANTHSDTAEHDELTDWVLFTAEIAQGGTIMAR